MRLALHFPMRESNRPPVELRVRGLRAGITGGSGCDSGKMSPEAGCEDSGLSVEVWDGAVIPDYVVCFLDFLTQVELGCHYSHRRLRCKPAVAGEPGKLGVAVAGPRLH